MAEACARPGLGPSIECEISVRSLFFRPSRETRIKRALAQNLVGQNRCLAVQRRKAGQNSSVVESRLIGISRLALSSHKSMGKICSHEFWRAERSRVAQW